MPRAIVLVVVAAVLVSPLGGVGHAQVTFGGCWVGAGIPVASIPNFQLRDIAMAHLAANGAPVISYNPNVVRQARPQTRLFFYVHECAHHVLGHTIGRAFLLTMEQEADCWAIRTLVSSGRFQEMDVTAVQEDLARFGQGDWTHLPGPRRAINLRACLDL
jgi:hypothetical protein